MGHFTACLPVPAGVRHPFGAPCVQRCPAASLIPFTFAPQVSAEENA